MHELYVFDTTYLKRADFCIINLNNYWIGRQAFQEKPVWQISDNVQVKRRLAGGQMCRSSPGGAHLFFLPVRDPEEASEGQGGACPRPSALNRLLDAVRQLE